jgi:hypothetical protein
MQKCHPIKILRWSCFWMQCFPLMSHRFGLYNEIAQVHLKGKDKYELHDDVVVYFSFPTLDVAILLHHGNFL